MSCYISTNANRFYTAIESAYGLVPAIAAANRIVAVKLAPKQTLEKAQRQDKTGTRTFPGFPANLRTVTSYDLTTYMTSWSGPSFGLPSYSPLFQASLGAAPLIFNGGTATGNSTVTSLGFASPHGLVPEQAVTHGGELRFVVAVVDTLTVELNAPLSVTPAAGDPIGPTVTFLPATDIPSVSIFDYWTPTAALQRILVGAAVNKMEIDVNGDFNQFLFSGPAQDVIDSASFTNGEGGLTSYPAEPTAAPFNYSIIPGNLGQVWLGTGPSRFYTVTGASVSLDNGVDMRAMEFGSSLPRCFSAGTRTVLANFELYEQTDGQTPALYQAARQQSAIEVMFQLGQQSGQLFGVRMPAVVPQVPDFDETDGRLQWKFSNDRAQGTVDNEISVAFG
jgi:hypothetical protein